MIIGITGKNCSGKDTVGDYLKRKTFFHISLSDIIRDQLRSEKKEVTRENLLSKGLELRTRYGPRILAVRAIEKMQPGSNYVVTSIRNPSEVEELKKLPNFVLINVESDPKVRFQRMISSQRQLVTGKQEKDPSTFEEFLKLEEIEARNNDNNAQQLDEVINMSDMTLENNADLKVLQTKMDGILKGLADFKDARPEWDSYFMSIAKVVATRGNCMKRQVAAIIVKDRRIISTGYNGTPRGTKNCNEGGCPRCNGFADGGSKLDECLCSHGEENAIVQAAYHGISIKGSTLYTTFSPCLTCTKMIINAGIKEVVYNEAYPVGDVVNHMFEQAGVIIRQVKND